ncbi:hypothetical protein niasHS_001210 [Heterodera schachtii]|uniref:Integrase catalytic domain-containing protein n=1 Tax=Heterodera schachtii TaxID=97005 RepID=A0ABD2KNG0_HETSC
MTLTKEEIKALVFISGLSSGDRDLRERCLKMMEEDRAKNTDIKFERLIEECRDILSLRSAAAALENPGHGSDKEDSDSSAHHRAQGISMKDGRAFNQQMAAIHESRVRLFHANDVEAVIGTTSATTNEAQSATTVIESDILHASAEEKSRPTTTTRFEFAGIKLKLECFVAPTGALNLFGLPWIRAFELALQRPIATTLHIVQPEATFMATSSSPDLTSKLKRKFPEVHPWPSSTEVYERLHMDFAGPCADGNKYLVVVDSYSKWPKVIKMNTTTAKMLIVKFVWLFSRYGFPKEIVTDNGPPFKSNEISQCCRKHGIKQTFSPPFHPQSNGRAERFVDTLKRQMKKCARDDAHWVQNSLLAYRSTPNASLNGRTPAELFLGRPVRTIISLVKPQNKQENEGKNDKYKQRMVKQLNQHHGTRERKFGIGDQVQFINYQHGTKSWLNGTIESGNGVVWKNIMNSCPTNNQPPNDQPEEVHPKSPRRVRFADEQNEPLERAQSPSTVRRSTRERKAPKILNPDASKAKYDYV